MLTCLTAMSWHRQTHLEGIHQVIDEEEAPQLAHGAVHVAQHHVAVLLDELLGHGHIRVQVGPAGAAGKHEWNGAANSREAALQQWLCAPCH